MSNTTPEPDAKQALKTLESTKQDYVQAIVDKERGIELERLIALTRGSCTRREVTKALDNLSVIGAIRFELYEQHGYGTKAIAVYTTKPAPPAPVRRPSPWKKVEP